MVNKNNDARDHTLLCPLPYVKAVFQVVIGLCLIPPRSILIIDVKVVYFCPNKSLPFGFI